MTLNQSEFAAFIGISARRVRDLESRGLPSGEGPGREKAYGPDAVQWYIAYKAESIADSRTPDRLQEARLRKSLADAESAELELAARRGLVLPVELLEAEWEDSVIRMRHAFENVPHRYGHQLRPDDPDAGRRLIQAMLDEVLDELPAHFNPADDE